MHHFTHSLRTLRGFLVLGSLIGAMNVGQAMWTLDFAQQNLSVDEITLAECMQGLVNRGGPGIYYTTIDYNCAESSMLSYMWLSYLTNNLGMVVTNEINLAAMITQARATGAIKGLILYDSSNITSTNSDQIENVLTLAAQLGGLPVTTTITNYQSRGLLNKGNNCFAGLPVLTNLIGKWSTRLAADQSETNLLKGSSTNEIFYDGAQWYGSTADYTSGGCCESAFGGRDYAIKLNAFCFDYPLDSYNFQSGYAPLFTNVLHHLHTPSPVFGIWPGYGGVTGLNAGEQATTPVISALGDYWWGTHGVMNLSFLSGIPVSSTNFYLRRPTHDIALDRSKYYVLFQSDGGDSATIAYAMPGSPGWLSPNRGTIPMGWGMNPLESERFPVYLQWLNTYAGPDDTFFSGCCGAGYVWLSVMSKSGQTALGAASEPYLQATGIELDDIWGVAQGFASLVSFQSTATNAMAFTGESPATNVLLSDNIPFTRCGAQGGPDGTWYESEVLTNLNQIVRQVQTLAAEHSPPYFIPVFDQVDYMPLEAKTCSTNLGTNFVIVGVEDYVDLQRQFYLGTPPSVTPGANVLPNPNWTPTAVGGSDGGRDWTFTGIRNPATNGAYQLDDYYNAGLPPVTDGSQGFLVIVVPGGSAPDFQYAASDWYTASPGQVWTASIYAQSEYSGGSLQLNGSQVGVVAVVFANASSNIIGAATNIVLTSSDSAGTYRLGAVSMTAPVGTAYVQLLAGVSDPGGNPAGACDMDDAALTYTGSVEAKPSFPTNTPPAFVAAGQFQLNLAGTAHANFRLWSTTNLTQFPVTSTWTLVASGTFSGAGTTSITDAQATNVNQFYIITEP